MQLTEIPYPGRPPVTGYGPGFFRIGEQVIRGPALLLPEGFGPWPDPDDPAPLLERADMLDVVLLGVGAAPRRPDPARLAAFEAAALGVEVMATPAACRSYNVLLAEGRRVAAALLPMPE